MTIESKYKSWQTNRNETATAQPMIVKIPDYGQLGAMVLLTGCHEFKQK